MAVATETALQMFDRVTKRPVLTFSNQLVNQLTPGQVTEISGSHLSGLSSLLYQLIQESVVSRGARVLVIDCDRGMSPWNIKKVLEQHTRDVSGCLERVLLAKCHQPQQVTCCLEQLEVFLRSYPDLDLVLIDNIAAFHWYPRDWVRDLCRVLGRVKKESKVAVLVTKHLPVRSNQQNIMPHNWVKLLTHSYSLSRTAQGYYRLSDDNSSNFKEVHPNIFETVGRAVDKLNLVGESLEENGGSELA